MESGTATYLRERYENTPMNHVYVPQTDSYEPLQAAGMLPKQEEAEQPPTAAAEPELYVLSSDRKFPPTRRELPTPPFFQNLVRKGLQLQALGVGIASVGACLPSPRVATILLAIGSIVGTVGLTMAKVANLTVSDTPNPND